MPRPASPGVAEVAMNFTQDNQQVQNIYHVKANDGTWDVAGMQQLAGTFINWWNASLKPHSPNNLTLRSIIVSDLSAGGQAIEHTTGLPSTGTSGSPALPNSVTAAIKWGTGLRGRSFRGRTFHLGLVEGAVTDNSLLPSTVTVFSDAYNGLRTTLDSFALDVEFCVLSEVSGGVQRPLGICTPITGLTVDPVVDVQRRRLPGRGR